MSKNAIAHRRESDGVIQAVALHLTETAAFSESFAAAIGLPLCGRLLGLCHDLGKYSEAFQEYIREISGMNGENAQLAAQLKQGTIDHATAGAQLVWECLNQGKLSRSLAQILSVAIMSHHSRNGMHDFVSLDGKSPFLNRLAKDRKKTHLEESLKQADSKILQDIENLLKSQELIAEFKELITKTDQTAHGVTARLFYYGLLTRYLFSCLLDADRINTADFEKPKAAEFRTTSRIPDWISFAAQLDQRLERFTVQNPIDETRNRISQECLEAAPRPERLFTLTVPTGGGKTLASLRFALHRAAHAIQPPVERIIYVLPYTSIIDQNAREVRGILGDVNVLEHHSNLLPDVDNWRNRVLSENWDAPVVFTTSVQLLDAIFAKSTGSTRRMHQLANSILIFDEIQTLPVKTIHIFNNAINFLTSFCNTTVVLCTATQPLLGRVDPSKGCIPITPQNELVRDKRRLFHDLKRTEIIDKCRLEKWSHEEIRTFAIEQLALHQSLLIVCNTKDSARRLFEKLRATSDAAIVHLSTSMCPAHRRSKIDEIKSCLRSSSQKPIICVSTQLIEAGVDLDFGCVIRSLAGMESITQAGGRCNRHGNRAVGYVYILNFSEEILGSGLAEISTAQEITARILGEFKDDPARFGNDLLSEETMQQFYEYYFFRRAKEMTYPLKAGRGNPPVAQDTSILDLLTLNPASLESARRENSSNALALPLKQAFSTAAQAFQVIDAPTLGILVPYGEEGRKLIGDMAAAFANEKCPLNQQIPLLKKAQHFTVNAFPNMIDKLRKAQAIREVQPNSQIYYLDERHYHADLGVTHEALSELHFTHV
jgi:CRISPR-associated endonuclease/helicase Cas3